MSFLGKRAQRCSDYHWLCLEKQGKPWRTIADDSLPPLDIKLEAIHFKTLLSTVLDFSWLTTITIKTVALLLVVLVALAVVVDITHGFHAPVRA